MWKLHPAWKKSPPSKSWDLQALPPVKLCPVLENLAGSWTPPPLQKGGGGCTIWMYNSFFFFSWAPTNWIFTEETNCHNLTTVSLQIWTAPVTQGFFMCIKKVYGPFLWVGLNCLKARATSGRQFTFYHSVPRNSWYLFYRPRKDERLSRPWSHPAVLNMGLLDWKSRALTTRPLFERDSFRVTLGLPKNC